MAQLQFKLIADPAHAWLEVDRGLLKELGLDGQVSPCSYQHQDKVYLEEDVDASLFLGALARLGVTYDIQEFHTDGSSPIRRYEPYH